MLRVDISRDAAGACLSSLVIESESERKGVALRAKLAAEDHVKSEKTEKDGVVGKKGSSKKRKKPVLEADKVRCSLRLSLSLTKRFLECLSSDSSRIHMSDSSRIHMMMTTCFVLVHGR